MKSNALIFKYARRRAWWICLAIALNFASALFNGIGTTLVIPVLLGLSDASLLEAKNFPPAIKAFLDWFEPIPPNQRAIAMLIVIAIAIILKNLTNYIGTLSNAKLSQHLTRDLREEGLSLLMEVDLDYHYKMKTGDVIQLLNGEVNRTASAIRLLINLARIFFNITLFSVLMILTSWKLTVAAAILMGLVVLINHTTIQRSRDFGQALTLSSRNYSITLLEIISGMRLIRSTGNEDREYQKVQGLIRKREDASFASQANAARIPPINEISSIIALICIVIFARIIFANQLETLGAVLLTYLFLLSRLIPFIGQLNSARSNFANASASISIAEDFLSRQNKPFMVKGDRSYQYLRDRIDFKDLWFRYPDTDDYILKGIDLTLPKGTTLALIGSSGAGKSTLADLLPRFYDPEKGQILIDGQDLRDVDLKSLRRQMGIVSQETFLFNNTIRYNIAYARPQATDTEIINAAKQANAYEFIERLPDGLDTYIGDRGVLLSGGQRQRLSIARALLQDPDILILDEATSALDTVSERIVQDAIDNLTSNRTTLVIAHRLSTIQNADQIAVLDQGKVVELGTHQTLLSQRGHYARLCALQYREESQPNAQVLATQQNLKRVSYQMRTRLNSMLGLLQIMLDDFIDNPEESHDLIQESYNAALSLLNNVEEVENGMTSFTLAEQILKKTANHRIQNIESNNLV